MATPSAPAREITAADKIEFGNFWKLHPKSQDIDTTRDAWVAAVLSGVDPKQITAAAVAYAHEKKGDEWRFIKSSHRWIKERRYLDRYAPNTTSKPAPPRDPRADWPPHCKDLECDEQTRYRRIEDANGLRSLIRCPDCHPSRKDSAA